MKKAMPAFICILPLLCMTAKSSGQDLQPDTAIKPRGYWGSVGLGISSLGSLSGEVDFNAEMAHQLLLTANVTGESDAFIFSTKNVAAYNFLAGSVIKRKSSLFIFSAGLGFIDIATIIPSPDLNSFDLIGHKNQLALNVPISAKGYFVASPGFAAGLAAYLNLNSVKTTAGLTLSIAFGALGTKKTGHQKRRYLKS